MCVCVCVQGEGWDVALFDFPGQTADDLSFLKGALITVTQRVDAAWSRGRLGSREGLYPSAFTHTWTGTHTHTHLDRYTHTHLDRYTHTPGQAHTHTWTGTHRYTHTNTSAQVHTHTHSHRYTLTLVTVN